MGVTREAKGGRGVDAGATVQIAFRVPAWWIAEADRIARERSEPGRKATRTDAFRVAIARGFGAIAQERADNFAAKRKKGR